MAVKGLTKVADGDKADLLLGYQLAIDREKQINGFANGLGLGGWGPWGGGLDSFSATTSTVNIGTFVLGMYDPVAKKLIWIGAAQHAIEPSKKTGEKPGKAQQGSEKTAEGLPSGSRQIDPPSLRKEESLIATLVARGR